MRIAVLHWSTSSVGGINTTLQCYHRVAQERGDTFHVLASDNQRTKSPRVFSDRERVRGGDSFVFIDGYAPHHASNVDATAKFLRANYDVILTSFLCPHPTKAYGDTPHFLALLGHKALRGMPIVGYIHDAYWETYADWGAKTAKLCDRVMVAQKAYVPELRGAEPVYLPFIAHTEPNRKIKRDPTRVAWIPQWKNIKGIHQFWRGLPRLRDLGFDPHLFNNGIEYYKLRLTPEWPEVVGEDHFTGQRNQFGFANFYGCLPLESVEEEMQRASFMCDFQGHRAKYAAYLNGSYNHTILEALYFGAVPVVSSNMLKSGIAPELLLPLDDVSDYPEAIASFKLRKYDRAGARQFVLDNFDGRRLYGQIFDCYRTSRR